jgi:DNA polymerase-3 subunit alpha
MPSSSFVHLRLHSEYSLVDGLISINPLVDRALELSMPAVALTDITNFFGLIKFYQASHKAGLKPIFGSDIYIKSSISDIPSYDLTLLIMNMTGYRNLTKLISRAYQDGQNRGTPMVDIDWIKESSDGLIALCGRKSDIGKAISAGNNPQAESFLQKWIEIFPDRFYLELTRTSRLGEEDFIHVAIKLSQKFNCPVVATNDVRFLKLEDFEAHESRVCIGLGYVLDDSRRAKTYSEEQYLRSVEEMIELFDDIPEALENTVEIAQRCNLELKLGETFLPEYPVPEGLTKDNFFEKLSIDGLEERLSKILSVKKSNQKNNKKEYFDRLHFELQVVIKMGYQGYFLIVMDFIKWAKENGIPVGPGRGSGAGSLIAYALGITDLDPLEYGLLFERFLNPERVSMPDFDIDFCMDNRDRVISYVASRYGRDAVSQIITFGKMAARAVVRDVARVQGKPYGLADRLSKMIPADVGMTLQKAVEEQDILKDFLFENDEAQEIWDMAVQLEGIIRNAGKHAGGVVIAPTKLIDFSPLYCDEAGEGLVTQFDKDDVESAGLIKFDFLGLRTLTIIDCAVKMVNKRLYGLLDQELIINDIPLDDHSAYELIQKGETTAVFQLESQGMKDLMKRVKPTSFEDIIALVALYRPGPLESGMVDDFVDRKHGRSKVAYPDEKFQHQSLKPILESTYGVIVYQEQVMQIAQILAGYSLGEADLLRRAMGKKKPEEMAKQREIFEKGSEKQGIDPNLAVKIFDLVEKFAGYGFNKSHSAAYALLAYQTAYLKSHYLPEFMAAVLSADMQNTDKVVKLVQECNFQKVQLLPPDINRSYYVFTVSNEEQVIYGLGAIKGLGEGPVDSIISAREKGGNFLDLFDFCSRVDGNKFNKRTLDALIRSGAMDSIGPSGKPGFQRAVLLVAISEAVKTAEQYARNKLIGMADLFEKKSDKSVTNCVYKKYDLTPSETSKETLGGERDTLGLYFSGHPVDEYSDELSCYIERRISELKASKSSSNCSWPGHRYKNDQNSKWR